MAAKKTDEYPVGTVKRLVGNLSKLLRGHGAAVQGTVLADLLAMWLAGHVHQGGAAETDKLREEMLADHIRVVRKLVPENAAIIHGRDHE